MSCVCVHVKVFALALQDTRISGKRDEYSSHETQKATQQRTTSSRKSCETDGKFG